MSDFEAEDKRDRREDFRDRREDRWDRNHGIDRNKGKPMWNRKAGERNFKKFEGRKNGAKRPMRQKRQNRQGR